MVTYAWYYLLKGGSVSTIWPMFGIANQLLGVIALGIGTTYILRKSAKRVYAFTTFTPWLYMIVTVLTAGVQSIAKNLSLLHKPGGDPTKTLVNISPYVHNDGPRGDCERRLRAQMGDHPVVAQTPHS